MLARISRWILPSLILAAALGIYRLAFVSTQQAELLFRRTEALLIPPRHNVPLVATDEQLRDVLRRVRPSAKYVSTNNFLHALRLWGPAAQFGDPGVPDGGQLLRYFLDDPTFQQLAGIEAPPLITLGERGIHVRSFDDQLSFRQTSSHHTDDVLATLAESRVPLDTRLGTRHGEASVGELLMSSLEDFHLDRYEYEWSIISYARYGMPVRKWKNKYGQQLDADSLVRELVGHRLGHGPCNGTHRFEAMVVILRADEEENFLSARTRRQVLEYMKQVSQLLYEGQSAEGYWTRQWPSGRAALDEPAGSLYDRILVTGHHLEWLALAPAESQPPRETVIRAGQWLVTAMLEIDEQQLETSYGPLSHAARGLCLWRGQEPFDVWQRVQGTKPL